VFPLDWKRRSEYAALCTLAALAFSLALPTALTSISTGLFVIAWIFSLRFSEKLHRIRTNPGAMMAIGLFILYCIGTLYSSADWGVRLQVALKYHKLLYIPMIVGLLADDRWRRRCLDAFLAGMLLILTLSYLKWAGIVPHKDIGQGYFVFKGRIAHSIFMAFTVYLTLQRTRMAEAPKLRWAWVCVAILALVNTLFMVNGRTGQLILFVLLAWFTFETWGWRAIVFGGTALFVIVVTLALSQYVPPSRLSEISQEISAHDPKNASAQTSSGLRLEFYSNALELVTRNPLLGAGTGSFEKEYRALAESKGSVMVRVPNPHNEYLLVTQQLGLLGLTMLVLLFWSHWHSTLGMTERYQIHALRGLVITIAIGCLFNSLLLDSGEGRFYCVMVGILLSEWKRPEKKPTMLVGTTNV